MVYNHFVSITDYRFGIFFPFDVISSQFNEAKSAANEANDNRLGRNLLDEADKKLDMS